MKALLVLFLLAMTAAGHAGADPEALYRQGQTLFRRGEHDKALAVFQELDSLQPHFKKTKRYIAQCAVRLDQEKAKAFYAQSAAQAREILDVRQTHLAHIETAYRQVAVERGEGRTRFTFSSDFLFPGDDTEWSQAGAGYLATLKDYASTFQELHATVVVERSPGAGDESIRRAERRAIALGGYFFRPCGLPPQNIKLRAREGAVSQFVVTLETNPSLDIPGGETDIRGVLVDVKPPLWDPGSGVPLAFDVSLIDPGRVQKWTLRLVQMPSGRSVKDYSGTSDLWVSIAWDGKGPKGQPATPGEYQAILTASGFGGARLEDSVGFLVKSRQKMPRAQPPEPPAEPGARTWAQMIAFPFNQSEIAGASALDVKRLAATLKTFPQEGVVIEGFADRAEEKSRDLARARAETLRDALVQKYGINRDRLKTRGKDPRRAQEGESLQKALIFFTPAD